MSSCSGGEDCSPKRKRKVTDIALQWLAQRLKRCNELKEQVNSGSYAVDTNKVAASIVNEE